jgi:hypothetical protein
VTVARPSPDDDRLRFEALSFLTSYLARHGPPGVTCRYGKPPPLQLLSLQVTADDVAGELVVTPVWFLGPHRNDFVPVPVDGRVSFWVSQTRRFGSDHGASSSYEHILHGDASEVAAAVARWKAAGRDDGPKPVPPIGAEELARLEAVAVAGSQPVELVLDFDPATPPIALTSESREALAADLAGISPALLARYLPRDEKGRLALGAAALLASYRSEEPRGGKKAWLAALTPARRRDPQVVQIALRAVAEGPYPHIWDNARWLWDGRAGEEPEAVRWGVAGLDLVRSAAPWLMPQVLPVEAQRRAGLRSRPRRPPRFRLLALPHQTSQAKRSVMLVARKMDGAEPALEIEHTGWDYRLPQPTWMRPLEIDLRRFGLVDAIHLTEWLSGLPQDCL